MKRTCVCGKWKGNKSKKLEKGDVLGEAGIGGDLKIILARKGVPSYSKKRHGSHKGPQREKERTWGI